MTRFGSRGSYLVLSRPIVRKVRHFSKARTLSLACGASWLLLWSGSPTQASAWHSSKAQHPKSMHCVEQNNIGSSFFRHSSELGRCTMRSLVQCCQAASPTVCMPASTPALNGDRHSDCFWRSSSSGLCASHKKSTFSM